MWSRVCVQVDRESSSYWNMCRVGSIIQEYIYRVEALKYIEATLLFSRVVQSIVGRICQSTMCSRACLVYKQVQKKVCDPNMQCLDSLLQIHTYSCALLKSIYIQLQIVQFQLYLSNAVSVSITCSVEMLRPLVFFSVHCLLNRVSSLCRVLLMLVYEFDPIFNRDKFPLCSIPSISIIEYNFKFHP